MLDSAPRLRVPLRADLPLRTERLILRAYRPDDLDARGRRG
ncbi:hypothetical protein ABZV93_08920 [Actinopolymorpha sp. NPDC004070]